MTDDKDDDWNHREMCPDGACIGVIGADGTCKVCGRAAPNWGDERRRGMVEEPDEPKPPEQDAEDDAVDDDEDSGDGDVGESDQPEGDWSRRQVCPDGACVGVIGDDGKCKVCGRTAA